MVNRTPERAERLAGEYAARWAPMSALEAEVAGADVVVACAGASGVLISREAVAAAPGPLAAGRPRAARTTSTRRSSTCPA